MATTIDPQADLATKSETAPLRIRTLLLFLIGNRQAILDIASNRHALWIGALFVLSAAFARDYDGEDLLHEPWRLLIPFAASLAASFLLFVVACGRIYLRKADRPPFFSAYRSFVALFWMTAPLAWAYAIPYERFLSPIDASTINLLTLGLVALWRVSLMVRVVCVLTGLEVGPALSLVMFTADALALTALSQMPSPIINVMGGVRLSPRESQINSMTACLWALGVVSAPFWMIGALVSLVGKRPDWHAASRAAFVARPSRRLWGLAIASVLIWVIFLPATQREQMLRRQVVNQFEAGRVAEAIEFMSAHAQSEFPPQWNPPPVDGREGVSPSMIEVMETIVERPPAPWVRAVYLDKFRLFLGKPIEFDFSWRGEDLARITKIFEVLPEGPELARNYQEIIENRLKYGADMPADERKNLQALLDLAKSRK